MRRGSLPLKVLGLTIGLMMLGAPAGAASFTIHSTLLGVNENPPNASPATGDIDVTVNGDLLTVDLDWSGLIGGNPTAAHIHCCTPPGTNIGVAVGFPAFPAVTSGSYFHVFNMLDPTIYTASYLNNFGGGTAAGAEAALIAGLIAGTAYANIHNSVFPGGEIRANLQATVPEPATMTLIALGLAGAAFRRSRRR